MIRIITEGILGRGHGAARRRWLSLAARVATSILIGVGASILLLKGVPWLYTFVISENAPDAPLRFAKLFDPAHIAPEVPTIQTRRVLAQIDPPPDGSSSLISDFAVFDNRVALLRRSGILLVDRDTGKILYEIPATDSRGTFHRANSVDYDRPSGKLWTSSISTGLFVAFDPALSNGNPSERLQLEPGLHQAKWAGDRIVGNGSFGSALFRVYRRGELPRSTSDFEGTDRIQSLKPIREFGNPLFPGLLPGIASILAETQLAACSARGEFVAVFRWSSRLHIYAMDGDLKRSLAGMRETNLEFAVRDRNGSPYFVPSPDTTISYLDVSVSPTLIVALHSGRRWGDFGPRSTSGDILEVYTWDGHHVGSWTVGMDLVRIALHPEARLLYGLRGDEPAVVEFSLQPIYDAVGTSARLSTAGVGAGSCD